MLDFVIKCRNGKPEKVLNSYFNNKILPQYKAVCPRNIYFLSRPVLRTAASVLYLYYSWIKYPITDNIKSTVV